MPAYAPTASAIRSLLPGQSYKVWNAEAPTPGNSGAAASQEIAISRSPIGNQQAMAFDGFFSGAPGAFEIDVQVAPNDVEAQYQTIANGNITTVDAVNNSFHMDLAVVSGFVRALLRSRANAVNVTGAFSRG